MANIFTGRKCRKGHPLDYISPKGHISCTTCRKLRDKDKDRRVKWSKYEPCSTCPAKQGERCRNRRTIYVKPFRSEPHTGRHQIKRGKQSS